MEPGRLSTDALASFAVFADHLSFTRAAEELHISQPALHVKVRKLSETLGVPLYTRHGRRLALTPAGERVARFARDLDARVSAFLSDVRGAAPARVPALAAGEGAYLYLLGGVVRPGIRLINGDRARTLAAVRTGRADLGVSVLDVMPTDLEAVLLAAYPQVLVMPADHPLAGEPDLTLADLAGASLVAPPPTGPASRGAGTRPPRRRRPLDARRRGRGVATGPALRLPGHRPGGRERLRNSSPGSGHPRDH